MSQCEPEGDMSVWSLCQGETGKIERMLADSLVIQLTRYKKNKKTLIYV